MKKILILTVLAILILSIGAYIFIKNNKNSNNDTTNIEYEVVSDYKVINELQINNHETKQGYEIIEHDSFFYLIIYYGELSSYFSKLEVKSVKITGDSIKVNVELPNEGLGDAFSYPKAIIKLNKKPTTININNNSYKSI